MVVLSSSAGIAFALVCFAGLCAPLGAAVVVFMQRGQRQLLAAGIALAAGVMIFVSLTEVLNESRLEVAASHLPEPLVLLIVYTSFLVGMAACWVLDKLTDFIMNLTVKRFNSGTSTVQRQPSVYTSDFPNLGSDNACRTHSKHSNEAVDDDIEVAVLEIPPGDTHTAGHLVVEQALQDAANELGNNEEFGQLMRTGILISLALSFHNLPEGLATFVGFMSSPQVGITIAIAIAIHNIPEGIAIGVPMFFATGSRWKSIGWAAVSGLAEPIGALIGLAVYQSGHLNPMVMGILMGFTAGIMTGIAIRELIPRSMYYDTTNTWTFNGICAGIGIMAVSFILLSLMSV